MVLWLEILFVIIFLVILLVLLGMSLVIARHVSK